MDSEGNQKPTLIYFKTRGHAQIIRCVLLEMGVEFNQKFIPFKESVNPALLKEYKIEIKNLPYLIHNNLTISGVFPIIKYCCHYYNRPDLLGKTSIDQLKVTEIMAKIYRQKGLMLHILFKGLKEIHDKNNFNEGMLKIVKKLIEVDETTRLIITLKQMFVKSKQFMLGYLTIIDFFYYEKVFHGLNLFGNFFTDQPFLDVIKVERQYLNFFESTQFFKKHGERLSEYKVFFPEIDCKLNLILKDMWRGDPKFVSD